MKKIIYVLLLFIVMFVGCDNHECEATDWVYPESYSCGDTITIKKYCEICNDILETKGLTIEHELEEITISPTCEEDGYTLVTCKNCEYSLEKDKTEKFGHELEENIINPTCTEDGIKSIKCKNCDHIESEEVLKSSGHSYPEEDEWTVIEDNGCEEDAVFGKLCLVCGEVLDSYEDILFHNYVDETIEPTCTEKGYIRTYCTNCGKDSIKYNAVATGHQNTEFVIDTPATDSSSGIRHLECLDCGYQYKKQNYVNNGYARHGKLRVSGADLVNQYGEKVQLIGLSTHGLQWAGKYVNLDSFSEIKSEFGINVVRLSLYTSEDGYCDGSLETQQKLYDIVCNGIEIATKLDMYVIVDWHMVGATDVNDKNPLYYLDKSKDFFEKITTKYKDYHNILYEIMNEPCGDTTWDDCKQYANEIIPIIRKKTSNVVLVGNPLWTSDLISVMKSPLEGYDNIMYTYHFYAADHKNTEEVKEAYDKGFPVFISEHGGMESSGDGEMNEASILNWYKVLDERNISYVAWNISNTSGSASILKNTVSTLDDFSDNALKVWGVWYKKWVRSKMGLN